MGEGLSSEMCSFERLRLMKQSLSWHHTCLFMGCMLYQITFRFLQGVEGRNDARTWQFFKYLDRKTEQAKP